MVIVAFLAKSLDTIQCGDLTAVSDLVNDVYVDSCVGDVNKRIVFHLRSANTGFYIAFFHPVLRMRVVCVSVSVCVSVC